MIRLCAVGEVPLNGSKRVSRGRLGAIAVFNLEGRFYATDDRCTHGAAILAAGEVREGRVYCPLHFGSFDIATGEAVDPPCDTPLKTHALHIEGGEIFLRPEPGA